MRTEELLQSRPFMKAVARIQRRVEKQTDWEKIENVFVATDLFERVQGPNTQLILGRRGTGKTHLARVLKKRIEGAGGYCNYIDLTSLGSGFSDSEADPRATAVRYFISLLNQLGTDLLDYAINLEIPSPGAEDRVFSLIANGLAEHINPHQSDNVLTFNYRQLSDSIGQIIKSLGIKELQIIFDEWATIPIDAQPYLAEMIKRAIATVPNICIKILAVNYQCKLSIREDTALIGMQRGADIPDVIELDKYLVYDDKQQLVKSFFGELLYNHIGSELDWDLDIHKDRKLSEAIKLFTQTSAFIDLVRAAEGNPRDFLCIFSQAYFDYYRASNKSQSISIPNIEQAAQRWYDNEKAASINANPTAQQTLTYLMTRVLEGYKSRSFLVESQKQNTPYYYHC